jgi:hypothetical protein
MLPERPLEGDILQLVPCLLDPCRHLCSCFCFCQARLLVDGVAHTHTQVPLNAESSRQTSIQFAPCVIPSSHTLTPYKGGTHTHTHTHTHSAQPCRSAVCELRRIFPTLLPKKVHTRPRLLLWLLMIRRRLRRGILLRVGQRHSGDACTLCVFSIQ